jgi:hypothetical protein
MVNTYHKGALRRLVQDAARLGHLDHECGLVPR